MKQLFSLEGKIALVTGGGSGIGRAIASALAGVGASVIVLGRRKDILNSAVSEIENEGNGKAIAWEFDLLQREQIPGLVDKISTQLGHPDILVNAAGVNLREKCDDISTKSWDQTLHLNLSVPFFLSRTLVAGMKKKNWGKIINIASLQSSRAFPDSIPYGASKGGICQLTRAMAEEWSKYGISCNAIAPGFFPTELTAKVFADEGRARELADKTAMGRNGQLSDLHGIGIFLSTEASDYLSGQTIFVDGGFTAK
ncbi:MAG: SDR family NAD(P)-dependent oxidoreductase [Oligoflexales bacterium]